MSSPEARYAKGDRVFVGMSIRGDRVNQKGTVYDGVNRDIAELAVFRVTLDSGFSVQAHATHLRLLDAITELGALA